MDPSSPGPTPPPPTSPEAPPPAAPAPAEPPAEGAAPAGAGVPVRKSGGLFFGVLLLLFLPGLVAQWLHGPAGLLWSEVFVFLLPAVVAAAGSNLAPARYLGLVRSSLPPVTLAVLIGVAGYLAANGVMALWVKVLPAHLVDAFDVSRIFDAPRAEQLLLAVTASVVAPLCEEIAFRGYLQRTFALRHRPWVAVSLTAVLFAALHLDPVRFPALLVLGLVFGWLAWRAGSTWPAVVAHAVNNGLAAGLLLSGLVPEHAPEPSTADAVRVLLWGGGALVLLGAAYRRATPAPPPPHAAVEPLDPTLRSHRFGASRVPPGLLLAAAAGAALLAVMAAFSERFPRAG